MQYSVPQFINVEDKVVGPFTGKQALFLVGGFMVLILLFTFLDFIIFIVIAIPIIIITILFAFWKPKGITVSRWIANFLNFYTAPHLYIWRREPEIRMFKPAQKKKSVHDFQAIPVSRNRIKELAWLLDTSTSISMSYETETRPGKKI
ncbi:MAG: PrgI family protein [Patescibacteria group bacterium]|nr:PrgI family protein [Patescibacteria group bacterium]